MPDLIAKRYLGDGVYVAVGGGMLVLTTEVDGRSATNTIYLEPEVYGALVAFYEDAMRAARYAQAVAITEAAAKEN